MSACKPRLLILRDPHDEGWPSMDLCAEMLERWLTEVAPEWDVVAAEPPMPALFRRLGRWLGRHRTLNADRLVARLAIAPAFAWSRSFAASVVHLVDHTYGHLALAFPHRRVGIYCHDLDAYRYGLDRRGPAVVQALARAQIAGLRRADLVFHNSRDVGQALLDRKLVDPGRLLHVPLGVADDFTPIDGADERPPLGLPRRYVLHVGNAMRRKRLDVLFEAFGRAVADDPELRLVQVGADLPPEAVDQIRRLGIGTKLVRLPRLPRADLARVYRGAAALLLPSEAEGFGLTVVEALACGTRVMASDIPAVREVGGSEVTYLPVGDVARWAEAVAKLSLDDAAHGPEARARRVAQAGRFRWRAHAQAIANAYRRLEGLPAADTPG